MYYTLPYLSCFKKLFLIINLFSLFHLNAQSLKEVAIGKGKFIGTAINNNFILNNQANGSDFYSIAGGQFNAIVAENAFKMSEIMKNRPSNPFNIKISDLNTNLIDRFLGYANANKMHTRGHVLVWYGQAPEWLEKESRDWSHQDIYNFTDSYIRTLVTYTKGKVTEWDVLNEVIGDSTPAEYRSGTWYDNVNSKQDFFDYCFKITSESDPNAKLFFTDYNIGEFKNNATSKNGFMLQMARGMKARNVPIDGVGFQSHYVSFNDNSLAQKIGQSIDELGKIGLECSLTELDLRICNTAVDEKALNDQAAQYKNIVREAFSRTNCKSIIIWGFTDAHSWIPDTFDGCNDALLYDRNYKEKPSYWSLRDAISYIGADSGDGIEVRARGVKGNEQLEIKVNGVVVKTFNVTTSYASYFANGSGEISITFNDVDGDAQVDWVKANQSFYQAEDQFYNSAVWNENDKSCGGKLSEWMHCSGTIVFASLSKDHQIDKIIKSPIKVYPNPVIDIATIDGLTKGDVSIQVVNASGIVVKIFKLSTNVNDDKLTLDLSDLSVGPYFLITKQKGTVNKIQKIMVK